MTGPSPTEDPEGRPRPGSWFTDQRSLVLNPRPEPTLRHPEYEVVRTSRDRRPVRPGVRHPTVEGVPLYD